MLLIVLYCVLAAIFVIGLTLGAEFPEERKLQKKSKGAAQVICIDSGRRHAAKLHKHA